MSTVLPGLRPAVETLRLRLDRSAGRRSVDGSGHRAGCAAERHRRAVGGSRVLHAFTVTVTVTDTAAAR